MYISTFCVVEVVCLVFSDRCCDFVYYFILFWMLVGCNNLIINENIFKYIVGGK